jgi:hypothetical protein
MSQPNNFDDLNWFNEKYEPGYAFKAGIDQLANGDYDIEIVSARLKFAGQSADRVVETEIRIAGGAIYQFTWWLNKPEAVNRYGADMGVLGFPAAKWGKEIPLAQAIPDSVAKLPGIKFRAHKGSREDTRPEKKGTWYHDLHVNARLSGTPMPAPATAPGGSTFNEFAGGNGQSPPQTQPLTSPTTSEW